MWDYSFDWGIPETTKRIKKKPLNKTTDLLWEAVKVAENSTEVAADLLEKWYELSKDSLEYERYKKTLYK